MPPAKAQAAMNQIWQLRDQAIVGIASRYVSHPWPINFLLIVDPLVTWIWIGALIVALRRPDRALAGAALARRRAVAPAPGPAGPARRGRGPRAG